MLSPKTLGAICEHYQLNSLVAEPQLLSTNSLHQAWRIQTIGEDYFLKKLNPAWLNYMPLENYQKTEQIAQHYVEQGLATISAISQQNHYYFFYDKQGWLLYPWLKTHPLPIAELTLTHVEAVAKLLAQLHTSPQPTFYVQPHYYLHELEWFVFLRAHQAKHIALASLLKEYEVLLVTVDYIAKTCLEYINPSVVVHGDFSPQNILWQQHQPLIIDWEFAYKTDPQVDLMAVLLDWCLHHPDQWLEEHAKVFLETYQAQRQIKVQLNKQHFFVALLSWLAWLAFNIEQFLDAAPAQAEKIEAEIFNTLNSLEFVMSNQKLFYSS